MTSYQIIALSAMAICIVAISRHFIRIIRFGAPKDMSEKSGNVGKGVLYSNTTAMLPNQKESSYLHLPTYSAGIFFHIGAFLCLLTFLLSLFPFFHRWLLTDQWIHLIIAIFFLYTGACGVGLFVKRLLNKSLRVFSNGDDFISNGLTTLFQLATSLYLFCPSVSWVYGLYYILTAILFLYIPVGKLKHFLYYFAARYHLGFFYGRRNVWPPEK